MSAARYDASECNRSVINPWFCKHPRSIGPRARSISIIIVILGSLIFPRTGASVPGVANHFGIDGNLLANSPGGIFLDTNDWLDNPGGTGVGVLDWNGIPHDSTCTFHFIDGTGVSDKDVFSGTAKVVDDPNTYRWAAGSVSSKDDIQHGLLHLYTDNNGDLWCAMAGDRGIVYSLTYIDFEFLQNRLEKVPDPGDPTRGSIMSLGPDGGRTIGDILLTIVLPQAKVPATLYMQRWWANPGGGPAFFIDVYPPAGLTFASANLDSLVAVPYRSFGTASYAINRFGEVAANLSQIMSLSPCSRIATVFIRTKSYSTPTSQLYDMIEPIQVDFCFDETPPVITSCPPDVDLQCGADTSPEALGFAAAEDDCDDAPDIVYEDSITPGVYPQPYTIERTWTAVDACGNSADCVQHITLAGIAICEVHPKALDFGDLTIGESKDLTFSISNPGGCALTGAIADTCEQFSVVSGGGEYDIAPGESLIVTVRFSPTGAGTTSCEIVTGSECENVVATGCGLIDVAVFLQSYAASWDTDHVEIVWKVKGASGNLSFEVMRRSMDEEAGYSVIHPEILREGDRFMLYDWTAEAGKAYEYAVVILEDGVISNSFKTTVTIPGLIFGLSQAHPNPFVDCAVIDFNLPSAADVALDIYDISGAHVCTLIDRLMPQGEHSATWDGKDMHGRRVASGIYFYRLRAAKQVLTKKLVVLR